MTAQISDSLIFNNEEYLIVGMEEGLLITPGQFGITPETIHTACYRGYFVGFAMVDDGLVMRSLTVRDKNQSYPDIAGVKPQLENDCAVYDNLDYPIDFTGTVMIADDFIESRYIHMGYQDVTSYNKVIELVLEHGKVMSVQDKSLENVQARHQLDEINAAAEVPQDMIDFFDEILSSLKK